MARYIQKISLRPFSETEIWAGWELEGHSGEVEGLIPVDRVAPEDLAKYGVIEFQKIPAEYVNVEEFKRK